MNKKIINQIKEKKSKSLPASKKEILSAEQILNYIKENFLIKCLEIFGFRPLSSREVCRFRDLVLDNGCTCREDVRGFLLDEGLKWQGKKKY